MLLFGTIIDWISLASIILAVVFYAAAGTRQSGELRERLVVRGRLAFIAAAIGVTVSVVTLGVLLVTHRFDCAYVYEHSAKAMDMLYWFPSMWSGQEGSFLIWGFWTALLGVVLAFTAKETEHRVMPVYGGILIFLVSMVVLRSPYLPLDTHGGPTPGEGLGLNPNLENPWMVIHPPTLFLGFAALGVPFSYALAALIHRDWNNWLRRALPWGLFSFSIVGLAMMMGGYWAYEMLGWGGFWGWDPVENGPLIPFLCTLAFIHSAQVQRKRGGLIGTTLTFALLPFVAGLYETFLTRTGVLSKFSVHSFSTLGGLGNDVLLGVLIFSALITVAALIVRHRDLKSPVNAWETPGSREFGFLLATVLFTLTAIIAAVGMSMPLITTVAERLHLANGASTVSEDFYNRAMFPIALLIVAEMGITPFLAWQKRAPNTKKLLWSSLIAAGAGVLFIAACRGLGTAITGSLLAAQILLFTVSIFALAANVLVLVGRGQRATSVTPETPVDPEEALLQRDNMKQQTAAKHTKTGRATAGGIIAHAGAAMFLLGIVCLVTFVRKDSQVALVQGEPQSALSGAYTLTYLGQTGDYASDKNNALRFSVASKDGRDKFEARLPFAMRSTSGGDKELISHPAIQHRIWGDLYLALKDGPTEIYSTPVVKPSIAVGGMAHVGPYTISFLRFERDPAAAAQLQSTGQLPAHFPVTAVLSVVRDGKTSIVKPVFILNRDNPSSPDTPEVKLPGGWLATFQGMGGDDSSGSSSPSSVDTGSFTFRFDSGPPKEAFDLEVSTRPMIALIWLGTLLMVLGGLISMRRRMAENRTTEDNKPKLVIIETTDSIPVATRRSSKTAIRKR